METICLILYSLSTGKFKLNFDQHNLSNVMIYYYLKISNRYK